MPCNVFKIIFVKWGSSFSLKYISISNVVINTLGDLKNKVTTAEKITESKKEELKNSYTWIEEIENFCNQEGILPIDLIEVYKSKKEPKEKYVSNSEKLGLQGYSGLSEWQIRLRNKKLGIKD